MQDVIHSHNLDCMFYADHTQICTAVNSHEFPANSLDILRTCVEDVFSWNTKNMLKSNSNKTEILHFTSRFSKNNQLFARL